MAGHFTHYVGVCASCILCASAIVQLAHTLAHPLNSYKKFLYNLGKGKASHS